MPLPPEIQYLEQNLGLLDNDKESRDYLRNVVSRGAFASTLRIYSATGTIDWRDFMIIGDTSGGAITLTLPAATYYGTDRAHLMLLYVSGAAAVTVSAAGSDTVNGGASVATAAGNLYLIINVSTTSWQLRLL